MTRDLLQRTTVLDTGTICPSCGHSIDAAAPLDPDENAAPKPDDVTICGYCTAFLKFGADMQYVLLTPCEIAGLPADVRGTLIRAREFFTRLNAERRA